MTNTLLETLKILDQASVLVVGDIMLDCYVYGTIERISPEAPIPILKADYRKEMLGGAGNVITNLNSLGSKCGVVAIVGEDENALKIKQILNSFPRTQAHLAAVKGFPTVTKTRYVAGNQQVLRIDVEQPVILNDNTEEALLQTVHQIIDSYSVVILSDYKKGLLTRKICNEVIALAKAKNIPVLVDPKGNDYSHYRGATLVKPNLKELRDVFQVENVNEAKGVYARRLLNTFDIEHCLVTLGKDGMLLVDKENEYQFNSVRREVFDVSGAGDTVIATLASSMAVGAKIEDACFIANIAGGIVVTKSGTASVAPFEIENEIESKGKIFSQDQLKMQVDVWKRNNFKVGITNGCFDILHAGHIQTLSYARKNCDKLIVALNTDQSVKRLKGPDRPVNNEIQRALVMAELSSVDGVVLFDNETPAEIIQLIRPDVLIKGGDYKKEDVVGYEFMKSYGGEVLIAPFLKDHSTTQIIRKLKE